MRCCCRCSCWVPPFNCLCCCCCLRCSGRCHVRPRCAAGLCWGAAATRGRAGGPAQMRVCHRGQGGSVACGDVPWRQRQGWKKPCACKTAIHTIQYQLLARYLLKELAARIPASPRPPACYRPSPPGRGLPSPAPPPDHVHAPSSTCLVSPHSGRFWARSDSQNGGAGRLAKDCSSRTESDHELQQGWNCSAAARAKTRARRGREGPAPDRRGFPRHPADQTT